MKKTMKQFFTLMMAVIMVLSLTAFGPTPEEIDPTFDEIPLEVQEAMEMQVPALHAFATLQENLAARPATYSVDDHYAGEYIDGDKLVILLVNGTSEDMDMYRELTGNSSAIAFAEAKYSLSQLERFEDIARDLSQKYQVVSYGVDIRKNKYMISVTDTDYENLLMDEMVQENADALLIEEGEYPVALATLYGGDKISNSSSGLSMSVCIGGTYNGANAILTCGHGNTVSTNTTVGQVKYQRCNTLSSEDTSTNSLGDFAIVKLSNSYTPSNYVRNATSTLSITGTYSTLPVGTTVYKYGASTRYSWGTVNRTNVTLSYPTIRNGDYDFINLITTRGLTESYVQNSSSTDPVNSGDSGGCVYIKDGSSYKIHGLVSAGERETKAKKYMYSTPIYYAINAGFSPKLQ